MDNSQNSIIDGDQAQGEAGSSQEESNTIELARLRLLEVINVDNGIPPAVYCTQKFKYILILDFEATCWDKYTQNKGLPEIIEFPCVLFDTSRRIIVEEFQQYVMPCENPKLSPFCTQLTGIHQSQVDRGIPLQTCLMIFSRWLKHKSFQYNFSLYKTENNRAVFATWSDWDLGNCLINECKRKRIFKPDYFSKWIDIRKLYVMHYLRRPKGLLGALNDVGLTFQGREHCGLDDARNTAMLVGKMIVDGVLFSITSSTRKNDT
ncbi:ERI1 exoribonuclease 2 isoform X2 [Aethina tumida]|uniref:ERI1 exoribonuclease 2 isoform X2 n=1 Tax=Aethina tumida TaxID=116153 RepID=UPI002147EE6D|nr:ERI1 exoribonuclease 2 isoform X2 [Aethina tumida]